MHSRNQSEQMFNNCMNYLDGVPVKIGEKFKPPRKITLPLNFYQRDPIELLKDDYSFNLEKQVLEWSESYHKRKEEKSKAKVEQVGHQIEQFTRFLPSSPEGQLGSSDNSPNSVSTLPSSSGDSIPDVGTEGSGNDSSGEPTQPPISCALLARLETNDILKPTPLDLPSVMTTNSMVSDFQSKNPIKLEDFEWESSPFDSVELKTLNDMEELKSVLQGIGTSTVVTKNENSDPAMVQAESGLKAPVHSKSVLNGTIQYFPSESHIKNGVIAFSPNYQPAGSTFPSDSKNVIRDGDTTSVASHSNNLLPASVTNFPTSYTTYAYVSSTGSAPSTTSSLFSSSFHTPSNVKMDNQYPGSQLSNYSLLTSTYPSSNSPEYQYAALVNTPGSDSGSSNGSLRNAHSTPDLLKEIGKTHKEERRHSRTHPSRPSSVGFVEEAEGVNYNYEQKRKHSHSSLKDVSIELSTEAQVLLRRMVDMGFPMARAARAVQKLGNNDKKVVEHLCAVQSLTEKGFKAENCETALFLNDENEVAAEEYLHLMKQFLDLGFEEEAIKRALRLTKNNRDKALDYLVS